MKKASAERGRGFAGYRPGNVVTSGDVKKLKIGDVLLKQSYWKNDPIPIRNAYRVTGIRPHGDKLTVDVQYLVKPYHPTGIAFWDYEFDRSDFWIGTKQFGKSVFEQHRRKIEDQNQRMPKPIRDVLNNPSPDLVYSWELPKINNPGFKIVGRAGETLDLILSKFKDPGSLPGPLAQVFVQSEHTHVSRLSLMNQLVITFYGEREAMGFRQWEKVGRKVKKGAKGIPILAPIKIMRDREVELPDGTKNKENYQVIVGFKHVIVFGLSQTEGEPYEIKNDDDFIKNLPFVEVARKWEIDVTQYGGSPKGPLGYYQSVGLRSTIALGVKNASTFVHELIHASDDRLKSLRATSKSDGEVVAEIGGATLLYAVGMEKEADLGGAYQYVKSWVPDDDPRLAAFRLLDRIVKAVDNVIQEATILQESAESHAEKVTNPKPKNNLRHAAELALKALRNGNYTSPLTAVKRRVEEMIEDSAQRNIKRSVGLIDTDEAMRAFGALRDALKLKNPHRNPGKRAFTKWAYPKLPLADGLALLAKVTVIDYKTPTGAKKQLSFKNAGMISTADGRWLILAPANAAKWGNRPTKSQAKSMYEDFRHYKADRAGQIDIPVENGFEHVGKATDIEYDSDKMIYATDKKLGRARVRTYVHRFDEPAEVWRIKKSNIIVIGRLSKPTTSRGIEA